MILNRDSHKAVRFRVEITDSACVEGYHVDVALRPQHPASIFPVDADIRRDVDNSKISGGWVEVPNVVGAIRNHVNVPVGRKHAAVVFIARRMLHRHLRGDGDSRK